ncbi:hypothetical protein GCM10027048_09330 [Hymenobacter coalescens]
MIRRIRQPYSLITILVLFVLMVQARLWAPRWDTHNVLAILTWDALGYYLYLPAQFIYDDLSYLRFVPDIMRDYAPTGSFYQAFQVPGGPEGALVMKYPCGLALLQTPFFFLGHWFAGWRGYAQDGFSAPYQVAIAFGGMLYGLLGLGIVRRVLLRYFSDAVTALTLALLVLGTNLLQYAVFDAAMPHVYDFALYALLLWATAHWHARPRRWLAAAIGLLLGLLILTRPSEAVAVLLPLLWGVSSRETARQKLQLLRQRWPDVLLLALFLGVGVLPQLLYWQWATGSFIFYSYQEQTFSFLRPHTWPVLFSFRKGWLIYTPLMALALAGLVVLWRRYRSIALALTAYFLVNLWVVSAWDIWWYGGSIGQRALVQSYAALSLGLAALLTWAAQPRRRVAAAWVLGPLVVLLVDLNLFQHWQYMYGLIHPEEMTRRYYWAIFGNTQPTQQDFALLDVKTRISQVADRYDERLLGSLDFDDLPAADSSGITRERGFESAQSYYAIPERPRSPALRLPLGPAGLQPGQWVRASCRVYSQYGAWGTKLVLAVERPGQPQEVQRHAVKLQHPLSKEQVWNEVSFEAPLAADVQPGDVLSIYVLSENGAPAFIDHLRAILLTPTDDAP